MDLMKSSDTNSKLREATNSSLSEVSLEVIKSARDHKKALSIGEDSCGGLVWVATSDYHIFNHLIRQRGPWVEIGFNIVYPTISTLGHKLRCTCVCMQRIINFKGILTLKIEFLQQ